MTDDQTGTSEPNAPPTPQIRDAQDASDHKVLKRNPENEAAQADIASDESFPASDPPSHTKGGVKDPPPSSGYDEVAEGKIVRDAAGEFLNSTETHLTGIEASGGKKLGVMRYVLGFSLTLVVLLFAAILIVYR